jgi:peptidoglycan/xylan/chitin deacetylase (PgdA/CDA1 family)
MGAAFPIAKRAVKRLLLWDPRPMILLYHRVADAGFDPWGIAVSPSRFEQQMLRYKKHRVVLSLAELVELNARGLLPMNAMAITFDDGYACNARLAAPLLDSLRMPATFFISTLAVLKSEEFWWDKLEAIFTSSNRPRKLELYISGLRKSFDLGAEQHEFNKPQEWRAFEPPNNRLQSAYLEAWTSLRELSDMQRSECLRHLSAQCNSPPSPRVTHMAMSVDELRTLSRNSLFDIGSHTVSHPALTSLSAGQQETEIAVANECLEGLIGRRISLFSYPFGASNAETREIVLRLGFACAVATESRRLRQSDNRYALPRIQSLN